MGTSFITDSYKNIIKTAIDNLHETFGRNITVYEEGRKVLIAASSEYNGIYGRTDSGSASTSVSVVSHTIKARIHYINAKSKNFADGNVDSQLDLDLIEGSVQLQVDASGYEILKEAKRCEFEGRRYSISNKGNPNGIFCLHYYYFFLKPLDE